MASSAPNGSSRSRTFGERDALALAARQLGREALVEASELDELEQLVDARSDLSLCGAAHLEPERDVVAHRHVPKERVVLKHEAEGAILHLGVGRLDAVDVDAPGVGHVEARDEAQDGALAAAARAEERDELAVGDLERDVVDGAVRPKGLHQVFDSNRHRIRSGGGA